MYSQDKLERGKHENRGSGGAKPGDETLGTDEEGLDKSDESTLPKVPDYDDLDISWGQAKMPDFDEIGTTTLPVAGRDNRDIYAVAGAVDSTDATVISSEAREGSGSGKGSTRTWAPIAIIAALLVAVAAGWFALANWTSVFDEEIAARVNGDTVSVAQLDAAIATMQEQTPEMFNQGSDSADVLQIRRLVLGTLVDELLLEQEVKRSDIEISDSVVEEQILAFIATYPEPEDFEAELASSGMTLDDFRNNLRMSLTLDAMIEEIVPATTVSEEEVRAFFDENIAMFTQAPDKRTSHILLPLEDRALGVDLLAELRDSDNLEESFAALAQESSADSVSASVGGDAGWPRSPDIRNAEYLEAVDSLQVGEMSDLIQTEEGYYIILVTDERGETVIDFEDAAPGIRDMMLTDLRNAERMDMMERLRESADIEVLDPQLLTIMEG